LYKIGKFRLNESSKMSTARDGMQNVMRSVWTLSLALLLFFTGSGVPERAWTDSRSVIASPSGLPRIAATNVHGQQAGHLLSTTGQRQAVFWDADGALTLLGTLGGAESEALALNDVGEVVGVAQTAEGIWRGFRWTHTTGMEELATLGGQDSRALAINAAGQIVGEAQTPDGTWRAVLWDAQGLHDLGTLGGEASRALAINAASHIAGEAQTADGAWHAFFWEPAPGLHDLGTLGGSHSRAWDVGDAGQVVGEAQTKATTPHAFLWEQATGLRDLGTLGGAASRAVTITADGRILGEAQDTAGQWQRVVWAEQDPADPTRHWLPLPVATVSADALHTRTGVTPLPIASAAGNAFVAHLYTQFYGRDADAGGLTFWTEQLDTCALTPAQVVRVFFDAPEFADVVAPLARLYFAAFGRIPDGAGLDFWVRLNRAGTDLGAIAASFIASEEFIRLYGAGLSNAAFVDVLYQNVLGRAADAEGQAFWLAALANGMPRGQVLLSFSESPENRANTAAEIQVTLIYEGLIGRPPEPFELATGRNLLPPDNLIGVLLQSSAYAGPPAPTPDCAVDTDRDDDGLSDVEEATRGTNPDNPDSDGDALQDGAEVYQYGTNPLVVDTDGDHYNDGVEIQAGTNPLDPASFPSGGGGNLPPDPVTVAPTIDASVATTTYAASAFLYSGANPIQTGVAPGTIEAKRAAVLRGKVLDKNNAPLSGVTITVHQHPEFGQTVSRADGMFDLAVNGGGLLVVNYDKAGYLPLQRKVNTVWQDWEALPDVVMIQLDAQVATLGVRNADTPMQVVRGSRVRDASGSRQATLLIPRQVNTRMRLKSGRFQTLNDAAIRATEYTVGPNGPLAMPGELPPTSAYTYAVELSADQALNVGATAVEFDVPLPFYVDNFLNFPVGLAVPVAYYDREKAAWVPTDDGRVIKILSISGSAAQVDTTGDGVADNGAALGMTDAERQTLAASYTAGQTLQRVAVQHFTPYDLNYGVVAESSAESPQNPPANGGDGQKQDDPCQSPGSVIECENQILGERIPLVGTGLGLNYRSDRVPGRTAANTLTISLSGATVPDVLKRIELEITVAGRTFTQSYPAAANQTHTFNWDGQDAYGRTLQGAQPVSIRIGYVYDGYYALPPRLARTFGAASGERVAGDIPARQKVTLWQDQQARVSAPDFRQASVGGWSLDVHHVYDPIGRVLYQGDGRRRSTTGTVNDQIITTLARFSAWRSGAVAADGSLYIPDSNHHVVIRVEPNGLTSIAAGSGRSGFGGDGGPATAAQMDPRDVAIGPDGSLYIADASRVRRVGLDGIITTIAGNGQWGFSGDGGPAAQAALYPTAITVATDGSVLIADSINKRIRRVGPDGIITTIAGNDRHFGDGVPATQASLAYPSDVVVAADGSVLIADALTDSVRRVRPDGIITTIAYLRNPVSLAIGPDSSIYIVVG